MAKIVVLDAFCWIKNAKIDFGGGFTADPIGLAYTTSPDLVGGQGLAAPLPSPRTSALRASSFGPLGLASPCLLTFDYLSPPVSVCVCVSVCLCVSLSVCVLVTHTHELYRKWLNR